MSIVDNLFQNYSSINSSTTPTNQTHCVTQQKFFFIEKISYLYIMCPMAIIGCILNTISIRVFNDKSFKTPAFNYLRVMTIFDLLICAIIIVYCLSAYTYTFNEYDLYIRLFYVAYIFIPMANIFSNLTMLLKLLVTAERLVSIRWPTRKHKLFKKSRYYLSLAIVGLISILFNIFNFFMYRIQLCDNQLHPRQFTMSIYWKIFGYIKEVLMRIVPIMLLVAANCLLIHTVRLSRKRMLKKRPSTSGQQTTAAMNNKRNFIEIEGQSCISIAPPSNVYSQPPPPAQALSQQNFSTKRSRQDAQLTTMTIVVAAMYSVSSIPMVFAYPGLVFTAEETSHKFYRIYAVIVNILELVQTAFRFFIYFSFTTQFRVVFYSLMSFNNKTKVNNQLRKASCNNNNDTNGTTTTTTFNNNNNESVKLYVFEQTRSLFNCCFNRNNKKTNYEKGSQTAINNTNNTEDTLITNNNNKKEAATKTKNVNNTRM